MIVPSIVSFDQDMYICVRQRVCYKCEKVSQENGIETNCDSQLVTITDMFNTFRVLTSG